MPTAAEGGEQVHQRLQMRVLHLNEGVLRAEQRISVLSTVSTFTVPADICACANSYARFALATAALPLLLRGLAHRHERALDVADVVNTVL